MAEDPQPMTLQQRIAALNAAHIGRIPGEPPRPAPQIPTRRPELTKSKSINNPPEKTNGAVSVTNAPAGNKPAPPPLPARRPPPPLPARKSSSDVERRDSLESLASSVVTNSSAGTRSTTTTRANSTERVKAPAWGECELPVIQSKAPPAKRTYTDDRPKYVNRAPSSQASVTTVASTDRRPSQPSLPPRLPPRKASVDQQLGTSNGELRKMPPIPTTADIERAQRSALSWGMNKQQPQQPQQPAEEPTMPAPTQPYQTPGTHKDTLSMFKSSASSLMAKAMNKSDSHIAQPAATAPPVPQSSRPDLSAIQATKPKFNATSNGAETVAPTDVCLVCRDFSGPDNHAARFPRQNVRDLPTLAYDLTAPFDSLTDKARAIFSWLHYNISYDVESFFNNNVRGSTPESTLRSGLAVCEGYAGLFTNLATHAGLESVVITGHGKGYGYTPLAAGSPLPPYDAGHAWNAVRIDNGEWKLIDACWGSGHVQGKGMPYVAKFNPDFFAMSNEEFAIKHFPGNREHFFLPGGRQMNWEEYIQINPDHWPSMMDAPTIFTNAKEDYYIAERSVLPRNRKISVNHGGLVRFQFSLRCPHWTLDGHGSKGPAPVFFVMVGGVDGRNKDSVPMEYYKAPAGQGGDLWYVDIDSRELGAPGQTLTLFSVSRFGDRQEQETRGMTVKEFVAGKGRVAMGFTGVAAWELVQ